MQYVSDKIRVLQHNISQQNSRHKVFLSNNQNKRTMIVALKVHKIENFFGSDFEFCTISLLVMFKY